jgi:hypothetical protein
MNQEELMSYVQEEVDKHWQLPNRPDLKEDCVNYIWERWDTEDMTKDDIYVVYLFIQFLSYHCREAVSSQDIEYMAIAEKERLLTMT